MAMLMSELHCVKVEVRGWDNELTPALMALSEQASELDLRDESDVITPAAALLALVRGGRITGAAHSRGKESDRILRTVEMLAAFGMASNATDDGIEIPGGQVPARPESPVETHGDHRIAMTAMVLASKGRRHHRQPGDQRRYRSRVHREIDRFGEVVWRSSRGIWGLTCCSSWWL